MAAEKKARAEAEELRNQIKKNQDNERKERRKLADEEAVKKIKALEDHLQSVQKNLASQKQVRIILYNFFYFGYCLIYPRLFDYINHSNCIDQTVPTLGSKWN